MRVTKVLAIFVIAVLVVFEVQTGGAHAWGPRAREGIAHTSIRVVSPMLGAVLREYEDEIIAGATVSEQKLLERFPHYGFEDPILAVDAEIDLLRAAKVSGFSPYLAYRLGVLGQLVAAMNQPFFAVPGSKSDRRLKERYEADAESFASGIPYESANREYVVDVRSYFDQRREYLKDAEALIASDYKSGAGFTGYAKRSLNVIFSNAVNAVADVWYTVLGEAPVPTRAPVRVVSLRDYYVDAIGFYLQRDKDERAGAQLELLENTGTLDADTLKKVADKYFGNARYDRAISMYRTVLEKDPRRADVRKRISDYFFSEGLALLEQRKYGEAEQAFDQVLQTDVGRGDAREKKLEAAKLLAERQDRLAVAKQRVEDAERKAESAARAEAQRKFAEAVALYRQANSMYVQVSTEFEEEFLAAEEASRRIEAKIQRLKDQLVEEVRALQYEAVRGHALELIEDASERNVRSLATRLVQDEHAGEVEALRAQLVQQEKEALRR
jgi:tetratricopeptide (TPR) repeat protein